MINPVNFLRRSFLAPNAQTPRHKPVPLPGADDPEWKWEPAPGQALILMKDNAMAVANAVEVVWPDATLHIGTCGVHGTIRWFSNNRNLFLAKGLDYTALVKKMQNDFNNMRDDCPFIATKTVLLQKMIDKWFNEYGEKEMTTAWVASWAEEMLTRAELQRFNPRGGSFPTDNNMVEVANNNDKE
jgi:hypothetical protein